MTTNQEREWREEAERLQPLDRETQRQVIALHRSTADNPKATRADRRFARERAAFLERLLGLASPRPAKGRG